MAKRGTEEFRKQRAQDFKDQKMQSAKDFDFDQYNPGGKAFKGKTHISGAEVRHLRQNNTKAKGGGGFFDNFAALKAQKEAGAVFGTRAQKEYDKMSARYNRRQAAKEKAKANGSSGAPANAIDGTQTGENDATPSNEKLNPYPNTEIKNTQTQDVTQDNDISTNVTGNNNTVINNQDNSVRQYGGDNRSCCH